MDQIDLDMLRQAIRSRLMKWAGASRHMGIEEIRELHGELNRLQAKYDNEE